MKNSALTQKLAEFLLPRMKREGIGLWLIATRESSRDPVAATFGGGSAVGRMAIGIAPGDSSVRILGVCASYDVVPLERTRLFESITPYGAEGWGEGLRSLLREAPDGAIALDVSRDEPFADGLSHGLFEELAEFVPEARRCGAEPLVVELFGRKTEAEVSTLRRAAVEAESILRWALTATPFIPGQTTESELAERIIERVEASEMGFAWERSGCPSVQFGVNQGHAPPGNRTAAAGELVTIDFGVEVDGLVSDLQRSAVVTDGDIPSDVAALWSTAIASVDAGAAAMQPGVTGLSIDEVSRGIVLEAGCPDFEHATGHPLGYRVHDVGPMLGPDWPGRYGDRVHQRLAPGMVFTLEPGAARRTDEGLVRIGIEEDLVMTETGAEFLCERQRDLWTIPEGGRR